MTGSCLCGEIEFEVDEIPGLVFNCHCSRCRKGHAAAFATQAFAVRSTLRFKKGHDLLKEFDSSPHEPSTDIPAFEGAPDIAHLSTSTT